MMRPKLMQLARFLDSEGDPRVGIVVDGVIHPIARRPDGSSPTLSELLHDYRGGLEAGEMVDPSAAEVPFDRARLLPPIDRQEVWGAGVTYLRSKIAREEESKSAAVFYDRVFTADRPELFF